MAANNEIAAPVESSSGPRGEKSVSTSGNQVTISDQPVNTASETPPRRPRKSKDDKAREAKEWEAAIIKECEALTRGLTRVQLVHLAADMRRRTPTLSDENKIIVRWIKQQLKTSVGDDEDADAAARRVEYEQTRPPRAGPTPKLADLAAADADDNRNIFTQNSAGIERSDDAYKTAEKLRHHFLYCPELDRIAPKDATSYDHLLTRAAFVEKYRPNQSTVKVGGRMETLQPTAIFMRDKARGDVSDLRMNPAAKHRRIFDENGRFYLNLYREPVHYGTPDPAALPVLHDFMAHLIPDADEREFFLDWLAHKYQHPDIPGVGILMVCKPQGAGRGTLFRLNEQLFGKPYVAKLDASVLFGDGGQSQYTNQLAGSILCQIDEVMNNSANLSVFQRNKTYNRLKMLVEPGKRTMELIRKGLPSTMVTVFTSWLLATNNENAIPAEEGDRRFAVITNGVPLHENPELYAAMKAAQPGGSFTAGFVAAVAGWLKARDVSAFDPYAPAPMFKGKRNMIDLNANAVADAVEEVLSELKRDLVQFKDLQAIVKSKLAYNEIPNHLRDEVKDAASRSGWIFLGKENTSKTARGLIYARDEAAAELWRKTSLRTRMGLLTTDTRGSDDDGSTASGASEGLRNLRDRLAKQGGSRGEQKAN